MAGNDQPFLGVLASVPGDIAGYGSRFAGYVEQHSNAIATELRDAIDSASWIPDSIRPPVRPAPRRIPAPIPALPQGMLTRVGSWVSENRTAVAIVLAFAGTTAVLIRRRKKAHTKKRRAHRNRNGKKKEIVVLACSSFRDPLTRSLALDLDRRGYIVYITVISIDEDRLVQSEEKWDIRPLWMDLTSSVPDPRCDIHPNLEPIRQLIKPSSTPSSPGSDKSSPTNSSQHTLAGLIILPGSTGYPSGPLATLPMTDLIDTVNTRLLSPILTLQQFLPLLAIAESQSHASSPCTPLQYSHLQNPLQEIPSLILAYPSIPTSLWQPNQVPEAMTTSSLSSLIHILGRELGPTSRIKPTELKLGLFDLGSRWSMANGATTASTATPDSALTLHWHSSHGPVPRSVPCNLHHTQERDTNKPIGSGGGSSLRTFHNAVFDILNPSRGYMAFGVIPWGRPSTFGFGFGKMGISSENTTTTTLYAGRGARTYDLIGKWVPTGLIGWMIRRQRQQQSWWEGGMSRLGNNNNINKGSDGLSPRRDGKGLGISSPDEGQGRQDDGQNAESAPFSAVPSGSRLGNQSTSTSTSTSTSMSGLAGMSGTGAGAASEVWEEI